MDDVSSEQVPETVATYLRLRGLKPSSKSWRRRRRVRDDDENQPFTAGRDPRGVADVLTELTRQAGWEGQLAREDVVRTWAEVAGSDTAEQGAAEQGAAEQRGADA